MRWVSRAPRQPRPHALRPTTCARVNTALNDVAVALMLRGMSPDERAQLAAYFGRAPDWMAPFGSEEDPASDRPYAGRVTGGWLNDMPVWDAETMSRVYLAMMRAYLEACEGMEPAHRVLLSAALTLYEGLLEELERLVVAGASTIMTDARGRLGTNREVAPRYHAYAGIRTEARPGYGSTAADALRYIFQAALCSHETRLSPYDEEEKRRDLRREARYYTAYGLSLTSPNAVRRRVRSDVVPWLFGERDPLAERAARG